MPLYEYECEACGHRFERIQKFSDAPPDKCPSCDGPVRKMQSAPAIQFKGTGWYITDYAKKDSGGAKAEAGRSGKKEGDSPAGAGDKGDKGSTDKGSTSTASGSSGSSGSSSSSDSRGPGGSNGSSGSSGSSSGSSGSAGSGGGRGSSSGSSGSAPASS